MTNLQKNSIIERPPIVVIMGHVDHGKSTLLDYIRNSNTVDCEAGGITQCISAYEVEHKIKSDVKHITFLDTPGHEAFGKMRSRGANIADIAILMVSAEDGIKPQTLEALESIKSAEIPFIIAINKIDKQGADVSRTKNNLLEHGIYLEGMGGSISYVEISAKLGTGVPELLDMILLVAEMEELTGDINKQAIGVVIEVNVDAKKGISATLVIKDGTLKRGGFVVADDALSPVRIFEDYKGKQIDSAQFSSPVRIVGWNKLPQIGATFTSYDNKKEAEIAISKFMPEEKDYAVIVTEDKNSEVGILPLIIKVDVAGTLEAIEHEIEKLDIERVRIKIINTGVGSISENDVNRVAGTKDAPVIVSFNVKADSRAMRLAEQTNVIIKEFNIIYKLSEWLEEEARKRTPTIEVEETQGKVKVIRVFSVQKHSHVLGGRVNEGVLEIGSMIKIIRRGEEIGRGKIVELQAQKIKTNEVKEENEFGAKVDSTIEITAGDEFESYKLITK